jgi:hypothetical protein
LEYTSPGHQGEYFAEHLPPHFLAEFYLMAGDILATKASASDPDTLSFDEAMADVDVDLWRAASQKEIASLEAKVHGSKWTKKRLLEASESCRAHGYSDASVHRIDSISSTNHDIVFGAISKKAPLTHLRLLLLGVPKGD